MNRNQIIIGAVILGFGLLLLFGVVLEVDVWSLMCPLALIAVGVWLLLRPKMEGMPFNIKLVGDIRRYADWSVSEEDIWLLVGDVVLDMSEAVIPDGETEIKVQGFVGSVKMRVPQGVGVKLTSTAFITDARVFAEKQNVFISPVTITSPGYDAAEKKLKLETLYFVGDIRIKRV